MLYKSILLLYQKLMSLIYVIYIYIYIYTHILTAVLSLLYSAWELQALVATASANPLYPSWLSLWRLPCRLQVMVEVLWWGLNYMMHPCTYMFIAITIYIKVQFPAINCFENQFKTYLLVSLHFVHIKILDYINSKSWWLFKFWKWKCNVVRLQMK